MDSKFAITRRGIKLMIVGLAVMVAGYALLSGGGVTDPEVFNYEMFSSRRLDLAPAVIFCGVIIEIVAIMGCRPKKEE